MEFEKFLDWTRSRASRPELGPLHGMIVEKAREGGPLHLLALSVASEALGHKAEAVSFAIEAITGEKPFFIHAINTAGTPAGETIVKLAAAAVDRAEDPAWRA